MLPLRLSQKLTVGTIHCSKILLTIIVWFNKRPTFAPCNTSIGDFSSLSCFPRKYSITSQLSVRIEQTSKEIHIHLDE